MTYLYLLIASGALFPLRFIPINYEWIVIAATIAMTLYQVQRYGIGRIADYWPMFFLVMLVIAYQSTKALVSEQDVDAIQFSRSLYGQLLIALGVALIATSPLPRERFMRVASHVLVLLTILVLASIVSGFRLYATGFLPEAGTGDIQSEVASGNYRIITYYTIFVVFVLFTNALALFQRFSGLAAAAVLAALTLIVLTGTRSLITPVMALLIPITLRYAKPSTTIASSIAVAILVALLYLTLPDIVDAYLSRFNVGQAFDAWRALEQELARQAIDSAPIFGLPLGTPYTNVMSAMTGGTEGYALNADYDLHNEYLWSMLYFGAVGMAMLAAIVFVAVKGALTKPIDRIYSVAFLAYLFVMLGTMNYSSALLKGYGALWFGIITTLAALRTQGDESLLAHEL